VASQSGLAGCGGVIRNCQGDFIAAFSAQVGSVSVVHAELWEIVYGLKLANNRGYKRIHVESDSLIAINLIRNGCNKEHSAFQLVKTALRFTEDMEAVIWQHSLREANQVADTLAKHSLSLLDNCKVFDNVPAFLVMPLMADSQCIAFPRGF
jgi:ribonuclease HI